MQNLVTANCISKPSWQIRMEAWCSANQWPGTMRLPSANWLDRDYLTEAALQFSTKFTVGNPRCRSSHEEHRYSALGRPHPRRTRAAAGKCVVRGAERAGR